MLAGMLPIAVAVKPWCVLWCYLMPMLMLGGLVVVDECIFHIHPARAQYSTATCGHPHQPCTNGVDMPMGSTPMSCMTQ